MSVDFVICAKDSTVLTVIEIDDSSHANERRAEADGKKNRALDAAGVKIVRWQARALPDEAGIRLAVLPSATAAPPKPSLGDSVEP